jgi:hypothetical protein
MRSAARQNGQSSGDLRDGRQQSSTQRSRVTALQQPHEKPAALSLSATISQYFIGGVMPELANPVQRCRPVIEIRPFKGGWQCYEGPGVSVLTNHLSNE